MALYKLNVSGTGETELIPAVVNQRIIVSRIFLTADIAARVKFRMAGVDRLGPFELAAGIPLVLPESANDWLVGLLNENLAIHQVGLAAIAGQLVYSQD